MRDGRLVGLVAWVSRLAGLLAVSAVVFPVGRRLMRSSVARWVGLSYQAHVASLVAIAVAGVCLLLLAAGLRRRKRRAWQLALVLAGLIVVLQVVLRHAHLLAVAALLLVALLLANRRLFTAAPDPVVGAWPAVLVFLRFALAGVVINVVVLTIGTPRLAGHPSVTDRLAHAALALVGVSGPVHVTSPVLDDLTAGIGLVFGIAAVLLSGYFLLRSAEPASSFSVEDERRLRDLITVAGAEDSLAYFALRPDKSVVFSPTGKAAVTYRALAGVALSSGDPIGDPEAWPGAVTRFLDSCARNGWVPAVLGCSRRAATLWTRHRLHALELGDEAVVDATRFTLAGRAMRGVRQMVTRAQRAGYVVRVRRSAHLDAAERRCLAELAARWRGSELERGFSMALGRVADEHDPDCLVVTAEHDGQLCGILQFAPWGRDGLSLDVMRRDHQSAHQGLNELMIAETLAACPGLGVRRVSLNFATFRAALERGEQLGAGPVARLWARLLRLGSRWWQIDSLYRFNTKFHPQWTPRYVLYPTARDLPRIVIAALEAEGFTRRSPTLLRLLRRTPNPPPVTHVAVLAPKGTPSGPQSPWPP